MSRQRLDRFEAAHDFAAHVHTLANGATSDVEDPTALLLIRDASNELREACCSLGAGFPEIRYRIACLVEMVEAYRNHASTVRVFGEYERRLVQLYRRCPQISAFVLTGQEEFLRGTLQTTKG